MGERTRAEYAVGLSHQSAVRGEDFRLGLEQFRRIGDHVEAYRCFRAGIQVEAFEVAARVDGGVDQIDQRQRLKAVQIALGRRGLQRAGVLPARRQPQAGFETDAARIVAGRIQQQARPLHRHQLGGHRHPALVVGGGRKRLELDIERGDACGHFQMERINVQRIASPFDALAVAGDDQTRELVDRAGGRVVAGYPLRIPEFQRAGLDRDALAHLVDATGHVGGVDGELDRAGVVALRNAGAALRGLCTHR